MTLRQYYAIKRFHKRSVRLSGWMRRQDYVSPLVALILACLLVAWIWS